MVFLASVWEWGNVDRAFVVDRAAATSNTAAHTVARLGQMIHGDAAQ